MKYLKIFIIILIIISICLLVFILAMKNSNKKEVEKNIINNVVNNNTTIGNNTVENIIHANTVANNIINDNVIDDSNILKEQDRIKENAEEKPGMIIDGVTPEQTTAEYILYTLQNCARQYMNYVISGDKTATYNTLSREYITKNNITIDNVLNYVPVYEYADANGITQAHEVVGNTYGTYYIKYQLGESNIYFNINMDISTDCFSVIPMSESEYEAKLKEPAKGTEKEKVILKNRYNNITYVTR